MITLEPTMDLHLGAAHGGTDILFGWQAVEIPKGTCALKQIHGTVAGTTAIASLGSPSEVGATPFTLVAKNSSISIPAAAAVSVPGMITFSVDNLQAPLGISKAYQSNSTSPAPKA